MVRVETRHRLVQRVARWLGVAKCRRCSARASDVAKARYAMWAALQDLADAKSENAHLRSVLREYDARLRGAEKRAEDAEGRYAEMMMTAWAQSGARVARIRRSGGARL